MIHCMGLLCVIDTVCAILICALITGPDPFTVESNSVWYVHEYVLHCVCMYIIVIVISMCIN